MERGESSGRLGLEHQAIELQAQARDLGPEVVEGLGPVRVPRSRLSAAKPAGQNRPTDGWGVCRHGGGGGGGGGGEEPGVRPARQHHLAAALRLCVYERVSE